MAASLRRLARRFHPDYPAPMTRRKPCFSDIPAMAQEVAELIASRMGGVARGESPDLSVMLQRRGAALPARLRRRAARLARAQQWAHQPRIARQLPAAALARDHAALVAHLRPMGALTRWQGRATGLAARLMLAMLLLGAGAVWIALQRGWL